ncbi:MAG: 16S rRNA (adenine(1518)-N(6)/adenine(1519)-N(6))-dimethyltransferase RsmA [Paludibacteraceae bacterium]|nr:16S rRNA (adenine(1518)-N(6)/adenine(1519)-N(6))-dimethyltransferase RsmA [Paludibacteraceae bacterium]
MNYVKPKKALGQHFLTDLSVARRIAATLDHTERANVLEIGPGTGVLTQFLLENPLNNLQVVEIDRESVAYLAEHFPELDGRVIDGDFLREDLSGLFGGEPFMLIGNYPYNISSQIFFKALELRDRIPVISGMLQKEVAERLASPPGKKAYGILSVFLQAYYDIEYLFTVKPGVFNPPPKVDSAVIRMRRNGVTQLDCDEALFRTVVKATFNQRRKTIRNSVKALFPAGLPAENHPLLEMRPEQLSVAQFIELTRWVGQHR